MRKTLTFLVLTFVSVALSAQEKPLEFEKVIQVEGVNKTDLFLGLKSWLATETGGGTSAIDVEDKEGGLIIANYESPIKKSFTYACFSGKLSYTLKIQCRDGRFKARFIDFTHTINKNNGKQCQLGLLTTREEHSTKGMEKKFRNNMWKELKAKAEEISNAFFTSMENIDFSDINSNEDDNW